MDRAEFLKLLAEKIVEEVNSRWDEDIYIRGTSEPYRAAGDRLVDDALGLIE